MLRSLSVRDVVLIDRLDLEIAEGLSVLTGETGSGKSILLDALGLAIGVRADSDLIRKDATQAVVVAEFSIPAGQAVTTILEDNEIECNDGLILRRTLGRDGRSRAFINDQPVSIGLLSQIGEALVEVHNQFEAHGLLNPASHAGYLDAYGGHDAHRKTVSDAYRVWVDAQVQQEAAEAEQSQSAALLDELREALSEFERLDPQQNEEETLAAQRNVLMHREKLVTTMNECLAALNNGKGVDGALRSAAQVLARGVILADGRLDLVIAALDRALAETTEALAELERAAADLESDDATLEITEERLFALRALARRYNTQVSELPALANSWSKRILAIDSGDQSLAALQKAQKDARDRYIGEAAKLTKARVSAAKKLKTYITLELQPLMLEGAGFEVRLVPLSESAWGPSGVETVSFDVQTNPNTAAGPIHKVASGGELARLTLALKVVLAEAYAPPTVVFDEIDAGLGGAAAAAVGQRLAALSASHQVLVITHSPQVAARGDTHWRIRKESEANANWTTVEVLTPNERTDEIARMIAGAKVTKEARAAADQLLSGIAPTEAMV